MRAERTRKELLALRRLCAKIIYEGPVIRGPDPDTPVTKDSARYRAKVLVRHCLDKPVTENG